MKKQYSWNEDASDEIWSHGIFDSIEECIKDAIDEGHSPGDEIAVGICEPYVPRIDADNLLDRVSEEAYEEVGDVAEGWPEFERRKGYKHVDKLQEAIDKVFNEWLVETHQVPSFYHILPLSELVKIPDNTNLVLQEGTYGSLNTGKNF